jgi:hypothetical protein
MTRPSNALVFFGVTGDLAYKQIFPALQAMVKHGHLDDPVIGVARSGNLDLLRARVRDSLDEHGGVDNNAFAQLCANLKLCARETGGRQTRATCDSGLKLGGDCCRDEHPSGYWWSRHDRASRRRPNTETNATAPRSCAMTNGEWRAPAMIRSATIAFVVRSINFQNAASGSRWRPLAQSSLA